MEKLARKPSADPVQEKLRTDKANWNKDVSAFINDLIHVKKTMNGWPSKFFKERSRITQPIPADPGTIIGALAGDFQDLATRGNSIIREQIEYAKNRRQKQPKQQPGAVPAAAPVGEPPKTPDLSQQLAASAKEHELIKLASELEVKYEFATLASNPFSRFVTRLFNPKFGFGEAARIRRLRMAMLDNCVKSNKELKKLQKEIVKSSKSSITSSYKMTTTVWNYWNSVFRIFSTYKAIRPSETVSDTGGQIEDPELKKEKAIQEGKDPNEIEAPIAAISDATMHKIQDFKDNATQLGTVQNKAFRTFISAIEAIIASPKNNKVNTAIRLNIDKLYDDALLETNKELNTNASSFEQITNQIKNVIKTEAQINGFLGKTRHQIIPGATSGQRLEIYQFISQIRNDLDEFMNLLEKGFDQEQLGRLITQINREMSSLRIMVRSLHAAEKPEEASNLFF